MATSMAALSRRLSRALLSNPKPSRHYPSPPPSSFAAFSTTKASDGSDSSESEDAEAFFSDSESRDSQNSSNSSSSSSSQKPNERRAYLEPLLENGVDVGIYRATLVGRVGQKPVQKMLKSGLRLTMLSVGTGGMRNNRRPLENESPQEFAERSYIQWHRVCIYPHRLGATVMENAVPGSILYIDGNLETKVFTDPITGIIRRVREISVRRNGRIIFLGKTNDAEEHTSTSVFY